MSHRNIERSKDSASESDRDARILKQGRKLFIREFDKQLQQLQSLLTAVQVQPNLEDLQQCYRIAHTFKGSAPVFGYMRIGKLAEDMVRKWEWTLAIEKQDHESLLSTSPVYESIERTVELLLELKMELDIGLTEIQMDEENDPVTGSMLRTLKSRILLVDDDDALRSYLTRRLQLDDCIVDEAADVESAKNTA